MRKIIAALFLALGLIGSAAAQAPPTFPITINANSILGRLGSSSGPVEEIPFSVLAANLVPLIPGLQVSVNNRPVNEATYTLNSNLTDCNDNWVIFKSTSVVDQVTVGAATGACRVTLRNDGTVPVTLIGSSVTIDNQAHLIIAPLQAFTLVANGANYSTHGSVNSEHDFIGTNTYSVSYSAYLQGFTVTLSGTCTNGDTVFLKYQWTGQAAVTLSTTLVSGPTCFSAAIQSLQAQIKANLTINAGIGYDFVSYAAAYPNGPSGAWSLEVPESWPFVPTSVPQVSVCVNATCSAFVGNGSTTVNTSASASTETMSVTEAGNIMGDGAAFTVAHVPALVGRAPVGAVPPASGDHIGTIYYGCDTSTINFDFRDVITICGQMNATLIDPTAGAAKAWLHQQWNTISFESAGAVGILGAANFGVGTITPSAGLHLNRNVNTAIPSRVGNASLLITPVDTSIDVIELQSYGAPALNALIGVAVHNTAGTPQTVLSTDFLLSLAGQGYDGTGYSGSAAEIDMQPFGTWTNANHQSIIRMWTTPVGSTTKTEALSINPDGSLTLGYEANIGFGVFGAKSTVAAGGAGLATGHLQVYGTTSGHLDITVPAAAGTPVWTAGSNNGTPAVTASAPLSINTTTGNISLTSLPVITVKKTVFTGGSTYTPAAGMLYVVFECVGSGGGGAGTAGTVGDGFASPGGGSGSYSRVLLTAAQVTTDGGTETITINAAGAGGATGANNGGNGGTVIVGSRLTCNGGSGATATSATGLGIPGAGGTVATGDIASGGSPGGGGFFALVATILAPSGHGASSYFGGGADSVSQNGAGCTTGANALAYGSGGSGAICYNTASTAAGGNGSIGVVYAFEFNSQ